MFLHHRYFACVCILDIRERIIAPKPELTSLASGLKVIQRNVWSLRSLTIMCLTVVVFQPQWISLMSFDFVLKTLYLLIFPKFISNPSQKTVVSDLYWLIRKVALYSPSARSVRFVSQPRKFFECKSWFNSLSSCFSSSTLNLVGGRPRRAFYWLVCYFIVSFFISLRVLKRSIVALLVFRASLSLEIC